MNRNRNININIKSVRRTIVKGGKGVDRARGTRDFLPVEMRKRRIMEERMREIAERWGYEEIRTPTFERSELFTLKSGEAILKEMYEFRDKGGRHLALRPELTAPVIRMYVNELKMVPRPTKVYYFGNCFRYEEPQKARYREFWQFGTEIIGSDSPEAQAELIALAFSILKALGVKAELQVGHVGLMRERLRAANVDAEEINTVMRLIDKGEQEEVVEFMDGIGVESESRDDALALLELKGKNVLRAAKDRNLIDGGADVVKELETVQKILDYYNVDYTLNLGIARGLNYYTGLVFEVYEIGGALGAQNQICGGGSYRLAALLGGEEIPTAGFAFGFDRLVEIFSVEENSLKRRGVTVIPVPVSVRAGAGAGAGAGERDQAQEVMREAVRITSMLRDSLHKQTPTQIDLMNRSLSAQLKSANARGDLFAVLIGKDELGQGKVTLRDLKTGEQERIAVDDCVARLEALFGEEFRIEG